MRFKKIYIEISNSCNFNCSFCFQTERSKRFMRVDEFRFLVNEIHPFTDSIYLHVLGEPLLHPLFQEILKIASDNVLKVNISTNGSLLHKHRAYLLNNPVRQINVSLHDAEENIPKDKWADFIMSCLVFSKELSDNTYFNLRLWNQRNDASKEFNRLCFDLIRDYFNLETNFETDLYQKLNFTLAPHVFLQLAPRFEWTDAPPSENKTCYGLRNQIAILSDGNVVPCCIDADANILLGNIFKEKLPDILSKEKALRIKLGFEQRRAVEDWCKKCGFHL